MAATRLARIERRIRILEHRLDAPRQRAAADAGDVFAGETDGAAVRRQQAEQHAGERRFAGTGFADQADHLALRHVEIDVGDGMQRALAREQAAPDQEAA